MLRKNVLRMSDEEIEEVENQMKDEGGGDDFGSR